MKKLLSILSLVALVGLGFTQLSYAEDMAATAAEVTTEAAEATVDAVAEAAVAVDAAIAPTEAEAVPSEAAAAPAPVPNKGDTAWMVVATVLVTMMAIPGLGLFYGGLVRQKNMLSVLMQTFAIFSLPTILISSFTSSSFA